MGGGYTLKPLGICPKERGFLPVMAVFMFIGVIFSLFKFPVKGNFIKGKLSPRDL